MRRSLWLSVMVLCAAALSACGGSHSSLPPVPLSQQNPGSVPTPPAQSANAVFSFKIPAAAKQQTQGLGKTPSYISASTKSISLSLNTVDGATPSPLPTAQVVNVTSTTNGCSADTNNVGNTICTVTMHIPVGTDSITIATYDGNNASGNLLSKQIYAASVTAGTANSFTFALDANPANATIAVASTGTATGSQGAGFAMTLAGGAQTFSVTLKDADNNTLVGPGQPTLSASSGTTATATVGMASNTLTITPVAGGTSLITVTAAPASGGAGLSNGSTSFNLTVSAATPTPSPTPTLPPALIAVVGTGSVNSASSDKVDIYQYVLGGSTITSYGTIPNSTLGGSNALPNLLAFDSSGNLYTGDYSNNVVYVFANAQLNQSSPTILHTLDSTGDIYSPQFLATAADNKLLVGNANIPTLTEYTPTTEASDATSFTYDVGDSASAAEAGTFIPGAGTFSTDSVAFVTSNANAPSGNSALRFCNGTSSCTISTTSGVASPNYVVPFLGWDPVNSELYLANSNYLNNGSNNLVYYTFSGTTPTEHSLSTLSNYPTAMAVSPDGHVAVATCDDFNVPNLCAVDIWDSTNTHDTTISVNGVKGLGFLANNALVVGALHTVSVYNVAGTQLATTTLPNSQYSQALATH